FFFQAEDGIRDFHVTGVQTCALPIWTGTAPSSGTDSSLAARPAATSRKGTTRMEQYEPDRLSPAQVAAMRRSFRNGRAALTRRSLLRASAGGALAIGGAGALSACGIPAAGNTEGGVSAEDHSAKEKSVSFSNWTEYMDV